MKNKIRNYLRGPLLSIHAIEGGRKEGRKLTAFNQACPAWLPAALPLLSAVLVSGKFAAAPPCKLAPSCGRLEHFFMEKVGVFSRNKMLKG